MRRPEHLHPDLDEVLILYGLFAGGEFKTIERKIDAYESRLNGATLAEIAKKHNVSATAIKNDLFKCELRLRHPCHPYLSKYIDIIRDRLVFREV